LRVGVGCRWSGGRSLRFRKGATGFTIVVGGGVKTTMDWLLVMVVGGGVLTTGGLGVEVTGGGVILVSGGPSVVV
jgi:hypothetical protein